MGWSKTFYAEAEIDVGLDEWDDEDLIEELESRDYVVTKGEGHGDYQEILDDIFELYKDWKDDQGDRDNRFEKSMRAFFEKHLNKVSA
jgi:hypothetical protein